MKIKEHWKILAVFASVAAVLSYGYFNAVDLFCVDTRIDHHRAILAHSDTAPLKYRVLVPFLVDILIRIFSLWTTYKKAFVFSYGIYDFAAIFLILTSLFFYLKEWFSKERAFIGALFVAGTLSVALRDHCFQPWSLLETGFYTLALWCCRRKWHGWLALIVVLSALTKESSVFILLVFLLTSKNRLLFFFYSFCWFAVFISLRYFFGMDVDTSHILGHFGFKTDIPYGLVRNADPLKLCLALLHNGLIFGVFWIFAVLGFRQTPDPFLKRVIWVIPFYFILWILMGLWWEARLLMFLYPFIIPLGLFYLYPDNGLRENQ